MDVSEPATAVSFRDWFTEHDGEFNRSARFTKVPSGFAIIATNDIPIDTTIARCPFNLIISDDIAKHSLLGLFADTNLVATESWSPRQWIASYLSFHWIVEDSSHLRHYAYLKSLPSPHTLRTSLHFNNSELQSLQTTNLYGATLDREREWKSEWVTCQTTFVNANPKWGSLFSWDFYLTTSTYLSSRAFPSSLLSPRPSLSSSPDTKPVLIPGVDALNHNRGQPVSWIVDYPQTLDTTTTKKAPNISLVLHKAAAKGEELFNNYGVKPNSELILGYGFSLPDNPEDTTVLKVSGGHGEKWEIGRSARGAEGLWNDILHRFVQDNDQAPEYENQLDAAAALRDMVHTLLDRLPPHPDITSPEVRPDVQVMLHNYIEGQRDIFRSLVEFAHKKEQSALNTARDLGIEIVLED